VTLMSMRSHRLIIALAVTVAALWSASAASAQPTVNVPAGNHVIGVGHGLGVQIYACNGTAWTFVAPRATLYDDHLRPIIKHFGGPTWQADDGSQVVGTLVNSLPVSPGSIPWLLLSAKSTGGPGRLAATTFIQRLHTIGGVAPAASTCTARTSGRQVEVPYFADYYFWAAN